MKIIDLNEQKFNDEILDSYNHLKKLNMPFFFVGLDIIKEFDSVSHAARMIVHSNIQNDQLESSLTAALMHKKELRHIFLKAVLNAISAERDNESLNIIQNHFEFEIEEEKKQ